MTVSATSLQRIAHTRRMFIRPSVGTEPHYSVFTVASCFNLRQYVVDILSRKSTSHVTIGLLRSRTAERGGTDEWTAAAYNVDFMIPDDDRGRYGQHSVGRYAEATVALVVNVHHGRFAIRRRRWSASRRLGTNKRRY